MDCSLPGSSVHGIFQARVLEWVAISFPMKVVQSCLTLFDPMDYTVHGILQAKILEWIAVHFSRGSSQPRNRTRVSCIAGGFFTSWATREAGILEWVAYLLSSGSSWPRNWTRVSCIAGGFFTNWAIREENSARQYKDSDLLIFASLDPSMVCTLARPLIHSFHVSFFSSTICQVLGIHQLTRHLLCPL